MSAPAPARRTSFREFQARNRRATWRIGAVCGLVIGGGGLLAALGFVVNLALVLFALVFVPVVALLGLGFLAGLSAATAPLREPLWSLAQVGFRGLDLVSRLWPSDHPAVLGALVILLPLGSWLAVRSVWLAAGVGETLLAMGARAPAPGDLEEHQLVNVVQEMAIAAGVPAPGVRLLDAGVANAAAVGSGLTDSHVVVGRRLLDEFDRDETQGVLGHLIGSIGNGDLRAAAQIHAMLYVLDLVIVIVLAPFARFPRRVARRWLAYPVRALFRSRERRAEEARALIRLLAQHRRMTPATPEAPEDGPGAEYFGPVGKILVRICPPLIALILLGQAATGFLLLFASLPVALLWRSRRYLADATAVELTRNPTGLYRALVHLGECGGMIPGGQAVSHLFIVGPEVVAAQESRRRRERFLGWTQALRARARSGAATGSVLDRAAAAWQAQAELRQEEAASHARETDAERGTLPEREGLLMGMQPSLARRLARLARMGAVPPEGTPAPSAGAPGRPRPAA